MLWNLWLILSSPLFISVIVVFIFVRLFLTFSNSELVHSSEFFEPAYDHCLKLLVA